MERAPVAIDLCTHAHTHPLLCNSSVHSITAADHVPAGTIKLAGQEHFELLANCVVTPGLASTPLTHSVPDCTLLKLASLAAADHVLEGTIKLGGQEHFYLEPNGAIVIPTESDEYTLISSTQAPNKHQVRVNTHVLASCDELGFVRQARCV